MFHIRQIQWTPFYYEAPEVEVITEIFIWWGIYNSASYKSASKTGANILSTNLQLSKMLIPKNIKAVFSVIPPHFLYYEGKHSHSAVNLSRNSSRITKNSKCRPSKWMYYYFTTCHFFQPIVSCYQSIKVLCNQKSRRESRSYAVNFNYLKKSIAVSMAIT